ncbi:MAG TPA: hypothetical protein VJT16_09385, partial [Streptosporangiaceae bacterium]|nr:hypothetical protein [Streptosporangiaceae bacterium]
RRAAGETIAARSSRPSRPGGRASKPTRPDQSSANELADDPRPHTDAASEADGDLTGTDLIMRELGGRMIEES